MADLFHLLDELNEPQQPEEEEDVASDEPASADSDHDDDREIVDLPAGLGRPPVTTTKEDEDRLDLQDFATKGDWQEREDYGHLQHWWVQELQAPEILPWQGELMEPLLEAAFAEEELTGSTTGNLEAILSDIRRVDKERVQFIVANLLQCRLHKIQACPWFYLNHRDRLSQAEVLFLKDFHALLEQHLQTTVTNHFPQEAWKRLDEPDMIEQPDLEQYVMVRALEDCTLRKGTEEAYALEAGSNLIVLYDDVSGFLETGAVQLIM